MAISNSSRIGLEVDQVYPAFKVVQYLEKGTYGKVFLLASTNSKKEWATKEINTTVLNQQKVDMVQREVAIHQQLKHPNIIQLFGVVHWNGFTYLHMELAANCLFDVIGGNSLGENLAGQYFVELIHGVEYMHSVGVAHRDIKVENLLISRDGKLIDYMAPEVVRRTMNYRLEPADIWACGVVLVMMLTGEFPWDEEEISADFDWKVDSRRSPFKSIDRAPLQLILRILMEDADRRASICIIKRHHWFKNVQECNHQSPVVTSRGRQVRRPQRYGMN
jgi:serine/threonine-protein kinase CHEK1